MNTHPRRVGPWHVKGTVPIRPANADLRKREYLTPKEVERLMDAARAGVIGQVIGTVSGPDEYASAPPVHRSVSVCGSGLIKPSADKALDLFRVAFGQARQIREFEQQYGTWPNGERMDDSEFKVLTGFWMRELSISLLKNRGVIKTPEETDRDKWASDVRSKISACERPQWLQDEKAVAQKSKRIGLVAFALLPPLLLLAIGSALIAIWRLFVRVQWVKTPEHIRRGLVRLYLAVSAPWVAWFGYHLLDALRRDNQRLISDAFWELLFVPVGFPIITVVILWVVCGFREPKASK
jgi:hypothetical protein